MIENTIKTMFLRPKVAYYLHNKLLRSLPKRVFLNLENNNDMSIPKPETRVLKVAVIGMPNSGKSTFVNSLMDRRVCATSKKVHTTRAKAAAIFTQEDSQIVFVDTPGLVNDRETKKFQLGKTFMKDCEKSLAAADIIGVVHDASDPHNREILDIKIIKMLESRKKTPSFLVLNKIDVLKSKRKLLDLTKVLTENHIDGELIPGNFKTYKKRGWRNFKEIFMVSALTGDGISDIRNYLFKSAKPGEWLFPGETWTDQTPETMVVNSVKAVLLTFLPQEIPYGLKPRLEYFTMNDNGEINAVVRVECPSVRIAKLVAGEQDGRLHQMTGTVQHDLQEAFNKYVKIRIVLQPPKEENKNK